MVPAAFSDTGAFRHLQGVLHGAGSETLGFHLRAGAGFATWTCCSSDNSELKTPTYFRVLRQLSHLSKFG
eukprot:5153328-Amphidinium_carterae.1